MYSVIESCNDFILVLSPGALDRCTQKDDWVRKEIEHAILHKKNIIPIMFLGFMWPSELPQSIESIRKCNAVIKSNDYLDAYIDKICSFLSDKNVEDNITNFSVDMRYARMFANCGNERTVFKINKSADGTEIKVQIDFEPNRIRNVIPEYAGVYYIFSPNIRMNENNCIKLSMKSESKSITNVRIEIKPCGKAWMHETVDVELEENWTEITIYGSDFENKNTLECIEEITFVIDASSFDCEDNMKGSIEIKNIRFE